MSRKLSPEEELSALARLLSHPVRVRILDLMQETDASASDLAPSIGEPLTTVAYHFKLLAQQGAIELRSTRQVRGTIERTYGLSDATRTDLVGLREWLGSRSAKRRARS